MIIAIIGLGIIGSRAAHNLRQAGHEVRVWSRTRRPQEPGWAESAACAAAGAEAVQIFVKDASALLAAIQEMLPVLEKNSLVINSATVSLEATLEAAGLLKGAGMEFLDCPFTGSRDAAAGGQLVYYAAGSQAAMDRARPVLALTGRETIPVGQIGHATVLKIATNMISATTVQVLAEALAVVQSAGVPLESFARAVEFNGCCSPLIRMKLPGILAGEYAPHFSLENMLKDSGYATALATAGHLNLPVLTATKQAMEAAHKAGHGDLDFSALALNYLGNQSKTGGKG